jgi:hypothetical protein
MGGRRVTANVGHRLLRDAQRGLLDSGRQYQSRSGRADLDHGVGAGAEPVADGGSEAEVIEYRRADVVSDEDNIAARLPPILERPGRRNARGGRDSRCRPGRSTVCVGSPKGTPAT